MPSFFKQALLLSPDKIGKKITKRMIRIVSKGTASKSPVEFDRIAEDYIDGEDLDEIYTVSSARKAMNTLRSDENLNNLLHGLGEAGQRDFIEFLLDRYGAQNIDRLFKRDITLKSGRMIKGYRHNSKVYVRLTRAGVRAYRFKNNTFAKVPKKFILRK